MHKQGIPRVMYVGKAHAVRTIHFSHGDAYLQRGVFFVLILLSVFEYLLFGIWQYIIFKYFCGSAMLEGPLRFFIVTLSVSLDGDGWIYINMQVSHTKKTLNLRFSKEDAITDFCETWYVVSARHKCYLYGLSSLNAHIQGPQ